MDVTQQIAENLWIGHADARDGDDLVPSGSTEYTDRFRPHRDGAPRWYTVAVDLETLEAFVEYSPLELFSTAAVEF